jgi:hypothetical protein
MHGSAHCGIYCCRDGGAPAAGEDHRAFVFALSSANNTILLYPIHTENAIAEIYKITAKNPEYCPADAIFAYQNCECCTKNCRRYGFCRRFLRKITAFPRRMHLNHFLIKFYVLNGILLRKRLIFSAVPMPDMRQKP